MMTDNLLGYKTVSMKKLLTLAMIYLFTLALLSACSSNNSPNNSSSSTNSSNTQPTRIVEIPGEPVDVADHSIYFVVIDGVKYDLNDATVQDFLNGGFTLEEGDDENREVAPHQGGGLKETYSDVYMFKGDKGYFSLLTFNNTDSTIPLKECSVTAFSLRYKNADISTVCNLALECTVEDVLNVFGDGYNKDIHKINKAYFYGSQEYSGNFAFTPDIVDKNKIATIQIFFV